MKPLSIPVRAIGPASQVEDEPLQYLDIPHEMATFRMPSVPQRTDQEALSEARSVLDEFADALGPWDPASSPIGPRLGVSGVSPGALAVINQMLGEGEVSIQIAGPEPMRIQESVFTGIWRVRPLNGHGEMTGDWIEAAALPEVVMRTASAAESRVAPVTLPEGTMNSPALLQEIESAMRAWRPNAPAHVVNLTLFPLTPEDHRVLELALPVGPVAMISRGFGNCRITSSLARNVWRVQYFNTMNTLILNTLEVVAAPEVALAAADDLNDSRERLGELVAWMAADLSA
ncbi:MAG TPA: hydrogenase expression/formation C-terminal domain-containing protein [Casimicrobiaceae bacterium]|nr:hydrogenase expression/formation C-terminal domain-containing protein [Casimicrobiaceae bacterium]